MAGLLNGNPQQGGQQPNGLLGINQGVVDWLRSPIPTNKDIAPSGQQSLAEGWTQGMGLPPWATTEQINSAPGIHDWMWRGMKVPDGQGGFAEVTKDDVLKAAFPHYGAAAGQGSNANAGGMASTQPGGGFPNAPFAPFQTGMTYGRQRTGIQDQAKEALDWLRSRLPQVK